MKKIVVSLVLVSLLATLLTGCIGKRDEKEAFIDATVEATCLVFQAENIFDPALEEDAKAIYKDHGFDADDEELMNGLTEKYQNDPDVQAALTEALAECAGGALDALEGMAEGLEDAIVEEVVE